MHTSIRSRLSKVSILNYIYRRILFLYLFIKGDDSAAIGLLAGGKLNRVAEVLVRAGYINDIVEHYFSTVTVAPSLDRAAFMRLNPDTVDVKELIKKLSPEEMKKKAEDYFSSIKDFNYLFEKPFENIHECPELLINFASIVQSSVLVPGQVLLEFGAGSCWAGRLFNQLGLEVISLDISPTALSLGKKLKESWPVFGNQPNHRFLEFDGYTIELPDESVDRIICFDSFHHVANPKHILEEFFRVLKPNGLVGFSEPGPYHSLGPQSQEEMKRYSVVENDIVIEDLWPMARRIGFTDFHYALISSQPEHLNYEEYLMLKNEGLPLELLVRKKQNLQNYNFNATKFFITKGKTEAIDSRIREGLLADIEIISAKKTEMSNAKFEVSVDILIKNVSNKLWLKSGERLGCINLGVHLYTLNGEMIELDYYTHHFLQQELKSGEEIRFQFSMPCPETIKEFVLELDLVSHNVVWFANNGSPSKRILWNAL